MKVEKGYTKLIVPHEGKTISAFWEPVKGNYQSCRNQLKEMGFPMMTSPELASFVGDSYKNSKGEFESKIIKIIDDAYIRSSTESLWLPKTNDELSGGVIGYDNPNTTKGKGAIEKNVLLEKLKNGKEISIKGHPVLISKDGSVRWTSFGYETGAMNILNLSKNPYNIVLHGEEGAEKIAEVASQYKKNPKLWGFDSVDEEKTTVSALDRVWGLGNRLGIYGDVWGGGDCGHAFGVCNSEKNE